MLGIDERGEQRRGDSRLLSVGGYTPAGFRSDGSGPLFGTDVGGTISGAGQTKRCELGDQVLYWEGCSDSPASPGYFLCDDCKTTKWSAEPTTLSKLHTHCVHFA